MHLADTRLQASFAARWGPRRVEDYGLVTVGVQLYRPFPGALALLRSHPIEALSTGNIRPVTRAMPQGADVLPELTVPRTPRPARTVGSPL